MELHRNAIVDHIEFDVDELPVEERASFPQRVLRLWIIGSLMVGKVARDIALQSTVKDF
jgi:hypothetical protein